MVATDNKRIIKNTVMLYFRMFITMFIGLFTSRIILNALGVDDYGIYNVVGGFVALFGLVTGSMSSSISRFITFSLGRGDMEQLRKVFATSIIVQMVLGGIVVLLAETVGLWFLYNKLVIAPERMFAAECVFHLSVVSFVVGLLSIPYNAAVVAHEEMGTFASFSIIESVARLGIVFAVKYSPVDNLILYACLGCAVSWLMRILYVIFCKRKFEECTFKYIFDKTLFRSMFGFAGWNSIGVSAAILRAQGGSILLNLFGGTAANAAAGVAMTLTGVVSGFVDNFTTAFNPQITKSYAAGEYERLNKLLYSFSRLSYYMMFFIALPVFLNARYILVLWLKIVPEHTVAFVRLVLLFMLSEAIAQPIITAKNATGKIRNYQLAVGGILLLTLPISYVSLRLGASVEVVYVSNLITSLMAFYVRMIMLRGDLPGWSSMRYVKGVYLNVIVVTVAGAFLPCLIYMRMSDSWERVLITSCIGFFTAALSILYVGCRKEERSMILESVGKIASRLKLRRK